MKKLLFVLLLAGIGTLAFAQDYSAFVGHYEGELNTSEDPVPITTVFTQLRNGNLSGSYIMSEGDEEVSGRLTWESDEGPNVILFRWKDKYGEGYVRFLFASDGSAFSGFWGETEEETVGPWNGRKE